MSGPINTYISNIPQASQYIRATQQPIQSNFSAISELLDVNHVGFSDADNFGKHNFTSLPLQVAAPSTAAGEMALFSLATSDANGIELFYRYPSDGATVQLTGAASGGIADTSGFAYMSSTVFMMWGTASVVSAGSTTITFPTGGGFPSFSSAPLQLHYQPNTDYTNVNSFTYISSSSTTDFVITAPSANYATSIYWLAIGM